MALSSRNVHPHGITLMILIKYAHAGNTCLTHQTVVNITQLWQTVTTLYPLTAQEFLLLDREHNAALKQRRAACTPAVQLRTQRHSPEKSCMIQGPRGQLAPSCVLG